MNGLSYLLVPLNVMHEIIGFLLAGVSYHGKASTDRISPYCRLGVAEVCGRPHDYRTSSNLLAMQDKMASINRWLYRAM